jgi:hypothetical protein
MHPSFDHGKSVATWVLDFSVPQRDGLTAVLGIASGIRGFIVHFQRNARKVAVKIFRDDERSIKIFLKIAYKIPDLVSASDVTFAFELLKGEQPFSEEESQQFLLETIGLDQEEASVNNEEWIASKCWADWWMKPRTLKMFSKAYKEMTDADWALFPNNTNAVESQNRLSQINTNKLLNVVRQYYTTDKNSIYKSLAAGNGIGAGPSAEKRKATNIQRQISRRNKRPKRSDGQKEPFEDIEEEVNPYIGKTVLVYTKSKRGKKFQWLPAKVELKNIDDTYT